MPILYSAVGHEGRITNSFASCDGNFKEITEALISRVREDNKMTYSHGRYLIHFILQNEKFCICITDNTCQRSRAFLFLNEIKRKYCSDTKFTGVQLASEMYRYNEDYSTVVIQNGDLDELNTIGVAPSESILGEKILLIKNVDSLKYTTVSYLPAPKKVIITLSRINIKIITILTILLLFLCIVKSPLPLAIVFVVFLYFIFKLDLL